MASPNPYELLNDPNKPPSMTDVLNWALSVGYVTGDSATGEMDRPWTYDVDARRAGQGIVDIYKGVLDTFNSKFGKNYANQYTTVESLPVSAYAASLPAEHKGTGGMFGGLADLGLDILNSPLGQIALAIATSGLSIPEQMAVSAAVTIARGGSVEDVIKNAVGSLAANQLSGFVKGLEGITDPTVKSVLASTVAAGTRAVVSGGDIGQALITGAVGGAVGDVVETPTTPTSGGDGTFLGGYEDTPPPPPTEPTNVANDVVDVPYGVNPRTTNTGTADPSTSPDIPEIYQGPQPPQPLPDTPAIDYGMTPTGTSPVGLTPTGGGMGLTPTAPNGTPVTGGVAGGVNTPAVGGITGSGTSVFDTFLDNLSKNPIQTAIKAAQIVSGIASGVNAINKPISPTDAQKMADPFASSRQQYIDKLNALMANPSMVMSQPGYQFALQQGMQGLNRNLSKSGMSTSTPGFPGTPASGAAGIAQQMYGQKYALKSYDDYVNQLSGLAGATQKPSAGSDAFMNAQKAASEAANSGWKSISQATGGLLDLFGGKSPQTGSTTNAPSVGGGSAAGGTTSGGGGNFSPANWNNPNWYLNPSPSQDITIPSNFDNSDPGGPIDYSDYSMLGP